MSGIKACNRALWSPDVLTRSVLSAWWCADDHGTARMTDDGSGLISSWIDRIGGMTVTATTTARPTWASTSFNSSKAGVTFDGSATGMSSTSLTTIPTGAVAGELWASCVQQSVPGANGLIIDYGAAGGVATANTRQLRSNASQLVAASDGSVAMNGGSLASPTCVSAQFSGTTMNAWTNGVAAAGNPTTIGTLNTGTTRARIGAATGSGITNSGLFVAPHIFILTGTLSLPDRQRFEGFLAWDGGYQASLPATHPYQRFRP